MTNQMTTSFKLTIGAITLAACTGLVAPKSASAAIVTGTANISIDNTAFSSAANGWSISRFYDFNYNAEAITASTAGGTTSTSNMVFPVNTNSSTTSYPGGVNRTLQATTMDAGNTASGQIGLSGALVMHHDILGNLMPYDLRLQKIAGTWNLITYDTSFQGTTFLQLANANESVNSNGQLSLSGDLIFGTGPGANAYPSIFNTTWGKFVGVAGAGQTAVVGSFNLTPAAVPVPAAVWMFGSGVRG
ncbi:MAG: hypothetical protein ABL925_12880, partial [Methylococcales bacterium]